MKILVTYAVQGEFTELKFPGMRGNDEVQVGYLRTGIGKVKSAYYLTDALNRLQPDLVINIGTAGTVGHRVGDIFVCRRFVDRDLQKVQGLGVDCRLDVSGLLEEKGYCLHWQGTDGVCNTGDSFLTELSGRRRGRYGSLCSGLGVPCEGGTLCGGEVCDRRHRAKFRAALGGQALRCPAGFGGFL